MMMKIPTSKRLLQWWFEISFANLLVFNKHVVNVRNGFVAVLKVLRVTFSLSVFYNLLF